MDIEFIGLVVGALITLCIFSYILGDNVLYRWALALLVGVGAGYILAIALRYLLFEWILPNFTSGNTQIIGYAAIPLALGALLLLKLVPQVSHLANISMGFLVGVGTGVAVAGILIGTMIPQIGLTWAPFDLSAGGGGGIFAEGIFILIGVTTALLVFFNNTRFLQRVATNTPMQWIGRGLSWSGRGFVIVALAAAYAGAITTALTLMVERFWAVQIAAGRVMEFILALMGS